jgi:glyoxylase-like metal-dependent hydrolase (beta-lactamase superfamily II)
MAKLTFAALAAMTLFLAGPAVAQQRDFSAVQMKTTDLGKRTYMLEGDGGNITVAVASDGIIMVDSEFAPLHDKIKAAIEAVSKQPIRYLINTHFHGDHTGGDEPFAKDGATVLAHENVRTRLAAGTTNGLTGAKTPAVTGQSLPSKTYRQSITVKLKDRTAQLKHPAKAHTDGDTYVYFADANVLATGDTVTIGRYPNIDFANGGNVRGMIAASDTYLKLTNDQTKIVPGHGPLADKKALADYRKMLVTARDRVAALIKQGKSIDEAVAAKPLREYDDRFKATDLQAGNFVRVVYNSLKPPA